MHWFDYLVFAGSMLATAGVGVYYMVKRKGKKESVANYFTGNHHLALLPTAFSLFSSSFSAITLVGVPAEIYTGGIKWLVYGIGISIGIIGATFTFAPFMYKLQLASVFEYLDRRYNSRGLKRCVAFVDSLNILCWSGAALYAPCSILQSVTEIPMACSIIVVCLLATFYSTTGGIRAVVWVDLGQGIVMLLGVIVIMGISINSVEGGLAEAWHIAEETGHLNFFDSDLSVTQSYTFTILLVSGSIEWFKWFAINQIVVQRGASMESRVKAQIALLLVVPQVLLLYTVMGILTLCIFAYYHQQGCDPLAGGVIPKSDHILPHYINDYFNTPGMLGVLLAAVFSGALSSLSSIYNSLAAVAWDELKYIIPARITQNHTGLVLKALTLFMGTISVGIALLCTVLDGSIMQISLSVLGIFSSTTFAIFLCAAFLPFTTAQGNMLSQLVGIGVMGWILIGQQVHHLGKAVHLNSTITNCSSAGNLTYSASIHERNNTTSFDGGYIVIPTITDQTDTTSDLPGWLVEMYSINYLVVPIIGIVTTVLASTLMSPCFGCGKNTIKEPHLFLIPALGKYEDLDGDRKMRLSDADYRRNRTLPLLNHDDL